SQPTPLIGSRGRGKPSPLRIRRQLPGTIGLRVRLCGLHNGWLATRDTLALLRRSWLYPRRAGITFSP
ncbi:MAG: hypothetical protein M3Z08_11750, partial [Chloroflexota bacterium]|nr:hypothetical protein [Chloroflexota bacterium]